MFKHLFNPRVRSSYRMLAVVAALTMCPAAQAKDDRTGAIIGGAAAGVLGGLAAGALLSQPPPPPPPPAYGPPPPVYIQERPREIRRDEAQERAWRLHEACDEGDRSACVRLGIIIGEHRERRAEWRRNHPEMFRYGF